MNRRLDIFNEDTIEKSIRKILPYFLIICFSSTIGGSIWAYLFHDEWAIGDWLINYQGGFIRRGFLGEIIYLISKFTHINPGLYVVMLHIVFYGVFFLFSYLLLKSERTLMPYVFLIFSPFIFIFQLLPENGGYRKEIIYFAFFSFFIWYIKRNRKKTEKIFYLILFVYPLLVLSHEMLIIFLPYFFAAYFFEVKVNKKKVYLLFLLLLPSIFSFFLSIYFHQANSIQVGKILNSLKNEDYLVNANCGPFFWITKSVFTETKKIFEVIKKNHYFLKYLSVMLLSYIAFVPLNEKFRRIFKEKISVLFISLSLLGTFFLLPVVADWGRVIYIHLVSIFFISFLIKNFKYKNTFGGLSKNKKLLIILFFILYTQLWHIPLCCKLVPYPTDYKHLNVYYYVYPSVRIIFHYFRYFIR